MKLISLEIFTPTDDGGLSLDRKIVFRERNKINIKLEPICLIGPNGSGKSQLLEILATVCQTIGHDISPKCERFVGSKNVIFRLSYACKDENNGNLRYISADNISKRGIKFIDLERDVEIAKDTINELKLYPQRVVGYTSGDNETISVPFTISRSGYARDVRNAAIHSQIDANVLDTILLLHGKNTNFEILIARLLFQNMESQQIFTDIPFTGLSSFKCTIQLNHSTVRSKGGPKGSGVILTQELFENLERLRKCASIERFDEDTNSYSLHFIIDAASKEAFAFHWKNAKELFSALHKFSMLNDLAIKKSIRDQFYKEAKLRNMSLKLPDVYDDDKIFRIHDIVLNNRQNGLLDYSALSDGEHQFIQILNMFNVLQSDGTIYLLDEPETHLNPIWRKKFIQLITAQISSEDDKMQDCIITTHAPFIASDLPRDNVLILSNTSGEINYRRPNIETYGSTYEAILDECFNVQPPISSVALSEIKKLQKSNKVEEIEDGLSRIGDSFERAVLYSRLSFLRKGNN